MRKISTIKAEISDCRARIKELQDEMDTINRMKKAEFGCRIIYTASHISKKSIFGQI